MKRVHYAALTTPQGATTAACCSRRSPPDYHRRMEEERVRGPRHEDGLDAVRERVTCPECIAWCADIERPRMTRAEFILGTVGAEVGRACGFVGDARLFEEFAAALPEMEPTLRRVDVQWWRPDNEYVQGSRYQLSEPGKPLIMFPGADQGPYVADGPLPPAPDWSLEIVACFAATDTGRYMTHERDGHGRKLTKRELSHAVNGVMGARTFR